MKFDEHVANYHRQINEAMLADLLRGLTKKPEKLQQVSMPSLRLENPKKNLAVVYQKLKIANITAQQTTQQPDKTKSLPVGTIVTGAGTYKTAGKMIVIQDKGPTVVVQPYSEKTNKPYGKQSEIARDTELVESWIIENTQVNTKLQDIINPTTGEIIKEDRFALVLYNAFSSSSDGIVTLDNLIRQRIGGDKYARHFGEETPYNREKAKASITEFIKKNGLANIIKMYDTYEAAQKGSDALQAGQAIRNQIVNAGKQAWDMATTKGVTEI
jgi:hypothetical protein